MIMTRENRNIRRKPVFVPLCPPQIPLGLLWDWTWASVLRDPRRTVRTKPRPNDTWLKVQIRGPCWLVSVWRELLFLLHLTWPIIRYTKLYPKRFSHLTQSNVRYFKSWRSKSSGMWRSATHSVKFLTFRSDYCFHLYKTRGPRKMYLPPLDVGNMILRNVEKYELTQLRDAISQKTWILLPNVNKCRKTYSLVQDTIS